MQVLGHVAVLEGVLGGFLRRGHRGVELAELVGEAHADFKGVRHCGDIIGFAGDRGCGC